MRSGISCRFSDSRRRNSIAALLLTLVCALGTVFPTQMLAQKKVQPKSLPGGEVTVFAAADMQPVLEVLGPYFERQTGIRLKVSYGASATMAEQIVNGAPADIFFSADYVFAERVVAAHLADSTDPTPYAKGLLVLWARKNSRFQPLSLDALTRKDLKSVAIANADRAPYGRAALAAIQKLGYYPNVSSHLVQAESVAQAAQFALSGNAELAFLSQTIAMSPRYKQSGTFVLFPMSVYPDIRQCAVIMKAGPHREQAHVLLNYITSDQVQNHLPELGLQKIK